MFKREGEYWTIVYAGTTVRLRDAIGLQYGRTRRRWRAAAWVVLAISEAGVAVAVASSLDWVACVLFVFLVAASVWVWFSLIDEARRFLSAANYAGVARLGKALRSRWEFAYVSAGLALLVIVGVLPSVAIYKDAFDLALGAFIRQGQRGLGLALAEREDKVRQRYNDKDGWPEDLWRDRIEKSWDLPQGAFFWDGKRLPGQPCPGPDSKGPVRTDSPVARALACLTGHVCVTKQWEGYCRLGARHFSGLAMAELPVYHRESGQLREFLFDQANDCRFDQANDCRWCADRTTDRNATTENGMTLNDPRLIRTGPTPGSVRLQRAELPTWPVMPPPIPIGAIWIFMGLAVAAGCVLIRWYARTLFDIDHRIDTDGGGSGTWLPAQGLVLLHPTGALRDTLDELVLQGPVGPAGPQRPACWIDLQESRSGWSADDWCGLVVVDHLEHGLDDSDFNRAKLALLERLVLRQKLHVVVLSKIDPLRYFCDRLQSPGDEKADERYVTSEEIDRWAAIMERLLKVAAPLGGLSEDGQQRIDEWIPGAFTAVKEWEDAVDAAFQKYAESKQYGLEEGDAFEKWRRALKEECRWTPHLRGIAVEAAALLDAPDDPMDRVGDLARAHYRTVWSTLTDQQRLVLIHLARNGFANPNPQNWPVVRHLAEQGLIRRTPALRLMNETFECFVKQVETEEQVSKWERAAGPSTWSRIRSVVVVASILIAVFLFQTQPQLLTYIAGGLAAAAGLAATVSNLLGFFQGRRVPSPPPQGSAPS